MKITSFIFGILIATIFFTIWNCTSSSAEKPSTAALITNNNPSTCIDQICKQYSPTDFRGTLSAKTIQTLTENYAADYGKSKVNYSASTPVNQQKQDALGVVFDLEELKSLIYLMESKKCANGCPTNDMLGIRYYFIKYPNLNTELGLMDGLSDLDKNLSGMHSLALVPVYKSSSETTWHDYNPWTSTTNECYAKIQVSTNNTAGQVPVYAALNHGGVCPPPFPAKFPID